MARRQCLGATTLLFSMRSTSSLLTIAQSDANGSPLICSRCSHSGDDGYENVALLFVAHRPADTTSAISQAYTIRGQRKEELAICP